MHCKRCGTELRENDEFCYHCGHRTTALQRIFSSRAIVGSIIAILLVGAAGVLTYFILTGKIKLPQKSNEPVVEDREDHAATESSKETAVVTATATPYVFQPADVTTKAKKEMKGLLGRLKPFLSYSASFYADGSHAFVWDDKTATVMALYNLEHYDRTIRYGNDMTTIKKATKKEMKKIFSSNYKYKFEYGESYPGYVYRPTGNTIVFNSTRVPGKDHSMQTKKIIEYEQDRYRVVVEAYMTIRTSGEKGDIQRYTVFVDKQSGSEYGYVVSDLRLYRKKDMKVG